MGAGRHDVIVVGARVAGPPGAFRRRRRTLLDSILVEAARQAGTEVRENFRVTQVTGSGGDLGPGGRWPGRRRRDGLDLGAGMTSALLDHQRRRDRAIRGMYDFTLPPQQYFTRARRCASSARVVPWATVPGRFLGGDRCGR